MVWGERISLLFARCNGEGALNCEVALVIEGGGMRGCVSAGMSTQRRKLGADELPERAASCSAGLLSWPLQQLALRATLGVRSTAIASRCTALVELGFMDAVDEVYGASLAAFGLRWT